MQSQCFVFILWESVLQCCTLICSSVINAIKSLQFTASLNNIHTYYQLSCDHSGLLDCYAEWQVRTNEGYWLSSCFSAVHTITVVFRAPKIMPGPMHTSPDWLATLACLKIPDHRVYKLPPVSQVWHSSRIPWQLKMLAVYSFKTFGITNPDTQCESPEEPNPQHTCCWNLSSTFMWMEWLEFRRGIQKNEVKHEYRSEDVHWLVLFHHLKRYPDIAVRLATNNWYIMNISCPTHILLLPQH